MSRVRLLPAALSAVALAACSDAPGPLAPHDGGMAAAPRASATAATTDRIVFMSRRDGNPEIYVVQPGGQPVRLTHHPADDLDPAWSPDGSRVAFPSSRGGGMFAVYTMNADGSAQARLTADASPVEERAPAWRGTAMRLPQAITFASTPPAGTRAGDPHEVTATGGGSGNPVVLSSLTPSTCTVAGGVVTFVAAGGCTVAADQAGNAQHEAAAQAVQQVTVGAAAWSFSRFPAPIDAAPTVNVARAGRAIPVKFTLGGYQGMTSFRDGYPRFVGTPYTLGELQAPVELEADSPSGLHYDAATGQYTWVWKTGPALAGRCGRLELGLVDGSDHHAVFRFTRRHGERAVRTA